MTKDEALKLALEALNHYEKAGLATIKTIDAIAAIKKVLAQQTDEFKCPLCYDDIANIKNPSQPEQEPVGGSMTTPEPPPECQTEAEKKAFAFGWWKAMEAQREDKSQEFPKRFDTHPSTPQRTWVGLTNEDKQIAFDDTQEGGGFWEFADAIEAKLKEKNT